ncbi:MAG: FAD:protein FMN transferase [Desulfovibrionaceae bacterium]
MVSRRRFLYSLGVLGAAGCVGVLPCLKQEEGGRLPERSVTKLRMGTFLTIAARHESLTLLDEALESAFQAAYAAESVLTRHAPGSPLGTLNAQGSLRDAPPLLVALLQGALCLARQTRAGFNPATLPALEALSSLGVPTVGALPRSVQRELATLMDPQGITVDGGTIRLKHSGMGVTLDGIAKGRIVDLVAASLERQGVTSYLVNGGGDIRVGSAAAGGKAWRIGIEDAGFPGKNVAGVSLRNRAMATSGNYESRSVKGYDHLVPGQEDCPTKCLAVTVLAPTCAEADALATALFAMGVERGTEYIRQRPACACLWQTSDGIKASAGWRV